MLEGCYVLAPVAAIGGTSAAACGRLSPDIAPDAGARCAKIARSPRVSGQEEGLAGMCVREKIQQWLLRSPRPAAVVSRCPGVARGPGFPGRSGVAAGPGMATIACAAMGLFIATRVAHAGEVSAYLPLQLEPEQEERVEQALALAGVPLSTRPIRVATLREALPAACEADAGLCAPLRALLARYSRASALTQLGIEASAHSGAVVALPNGHGEQSDSPASLHAAGYARYGDHVLVNAGVLAYGGRTTPTGTMLSLGGERLQLDVGYRDHWWSPARLSTQVMGTEAATLPSVTISNPRALTRAHFGYEIFYSRLSWSDHIDYRGQPASGYPRLFGFHVDAQPLPGWTLGISRLMQFGGGPRPSGLHDLFRAFFNATRYDNTTGALNTAKEFGNEQFSVTSSFVLPVPRPASLYFEYAAEDTFHAENYRFGGGSLTAGLYLPRVGPRLDLRYEFSDREQAWFIHHIYGDGLRNYGHVLGEWCGDWRLAVDGVGAQCHALSLGWQLRSGSRLGLQAFTVQNAAYGDRDYRRGGSLIVSYSRPWRDYQLGGSVTAGRDVYGERFGRLSAFVRFDPSAAPRRGARGDPGVADEAAPSAVRRRHDAELFVDVGVFRSTLTYEQDAGEVPPVKTPQGSAHLGLGMRRAFTPHSDLGARVEFDNLRGRLLFAVRALDYRYRAGPHLAFTAFLGAARYAALTPEYGWYAGAGLQWHDVARKWDLGLDFRRGDQMNRYKIAGEPVITWPNTFHIAQGTTLYLSRRF